MKYTNQALTRLSGRYSMEPIPPAWRNKGLRHRKPFSIPQRGGRLRRP